MKHNRKYTYSMLPYSMLALRNKGKFTLKESTVIGGAAIKGTNETPREGKIFHGPNACNMSLAQLIRFFQTAFKWKEYYVVIHDSNNEVENEEIAVIRADTFVLLLQLEELDDTQKVSVSNLREYKDLSGDCNDCP